MSDDRLRRAYAEELKQGYLKTGFKQGFEAGYAKAKKDFERPHGEWIKVGGIFYLLKCSNCNFELKSPDDKSIFCPNCGAYMKEGDGE